MQRTLKTAILIALALYVLSGMTVLFSGLRIVEILTDTVPEDSFHLTQAQVSHIAHVLGGTLFGVLGPLQFSRAFMNRFGKAHRLAGRVFVAAGALLSLSSLTLIWKFWDGGMDLVVAGRLVFGIALGVALIIAMRAIFQKNIKRHRDWMIRSYAIGIGATAVSNGFLPIYLATGVPPSGLFADVLFIGLWALCVVFAEWLVRRINRKSEQRSAA